MPKLDCLIVLAGGFTDSGTLPSSVKDRLFYAIKLYVSSHTDKIVVTGKHSRYWKRRRVEKTEASMMREYLTSMGIPPQAILLEDTSLTTYQNLLHVRDQILYPNKFRNIGIVTSQFHVRRISIIVKILFSNEFSIKLYGVTHDARTFQKIRRNIKEIFATSIVYCLYLYKNLHAKFSFAMSNYVQWLFK